MRRAHSKGSWIGSWLGCSGRRLWVYLDDIIVLGWDGTKMLDRLRLRKANLKLKPSKCFLFREQVVYLGHIVSADGVGSGPYPKTFQFVSLASYYRCFVQDFASVTKPLHKFNWMNARRNLSNWKVGWHQHMFRLSPRQWRVISRHWYQWLGNQSSLLPSTRGRGEGSSLWK